MTEQQIDNFITLYCRWCGTQRCPGPSYNMKENEQENSFCRGCPKWNNYIILCNEKN